MPGRSKTLSNENRGPTRTACELAEMFDITPATVGRALKAAGVAPCIRVTGTHLASRATYYPARAAIRALRDALFVKVP